MSGRSSRGAEIRVTAGFVANSATRLIGLNGDPACRNTVVVLVVGGGEGTTGGATNATLATTAATFVAISGRRVPIYVIAIAPPSADRAALTAIATSSGGQYFEITKSTIDKALATAATAYPSSITGTTIVPHVVRAVDTAIAHAFAASNLRQIVKHDHRRIDHA